MMEDSILLRRILEGLIHNLNNPLNLILGYAQRLQAEHPELDEAGKILKAGFQFDDQLQAITSRLMDDTLFEPEQIDMTKWLERELKYLQNYLPLKHKLVPMILPSESSYTTFNSPPVLSSWLESKLMILVNSNLVNFRDISLSIIEYQESTALRIGFPQGLDQDLISLLVTDLDVSSFVASENRIQSLWDEATYSLLGILP